MSDEEGKTPPLNPHREWPHKVTPLPLDWLLKFTTLGEAPAEEPHEESLEVWN